jgi:hypothetical protein
MLKNILRTYFTNDNEKLQCFSSQTFTILVECLLVRPEPTQVKLVLHSKEGSLPYSQTLAKKSFPATYINTPYYKHA